MMIVNVLVKAFLFYILYLGIRSLIDKFSGAKPKEAINQKYTRAKSHPHQSGNSSEPIEADYRVVK